MSYTATNQSQRHQMFLKDAEGGGGMNSNLWYLFETPINKILPIS